MIGLREFVVRTLETMRRIYQEAVVRQCALSYYGKGWILDEDLAVVDGWYAGAEATEE